MEISVHGQHIVVMAERASPVLSVPTLLFLIHIVSDVT